jgi:hypothetical protein
MRLGVEGCTRWCLKTNTKFKIESGHYRASQKNFHMHFNHNLTLGLCRKCTYQEFVNIWQNCKNLLHSIDIDICCEYVNQPMTMQHSRSCDQYDALLSSASGYEPTGIHGEGFKNWENVIFQDDFFCDALYSCKFLTLFHVRPYGLGETRVIEG